MATFAQGRPLLLFAVVAALAAIMFVALVPVTPAGVRVDAGEVATQTIRAPRDITFTSSALTRQRQEEAAAAVQETRVFDPSIASAQQSQLNTLLGRVRAVLSDRALSQEARAASLARVERLNLSPGSTALLLNMTPEEFDVVDTESRRALASIYEASLPEQAVPETRERASTYVAPTIGRDLSTLIGEIIRPFIVTNLVVDTARTEAAREAARAGVAPVQVTYAENQVIVERGSIVTPEAREALSKAGLVGNAWKVETVLASALVALFAACITTAGIAVLRPSADARQVAAIGLAIALPVFAVKVLMPLVLPDDERHFLMHTLPLAAPAMVLAGLVGAEVALLAAVVTALLAAFSAVLLLDVSIVGFAGTLDIVRIVLVAGLTGVAGVFAVRNAERMSHFLAGGALVAAGSICILTATWLIDPNREVSDLAWMSMAAAINGGLSAFVSVGIFVTLGSIFGVTTRLQLLEMSQLSQPLLLRLQDEAPSTFQHSVIVANLAEKGAHVIGADSLLARVGCYYHDIGKLLRPGFFIENQLGGDNPHDALDPADSARIISDHVKDGLALAREYKLPPKVAAFIPEHHGTRLVTYFYRRAAEENPNVDPEAFRYPGPKPQSRETAIAMLADSCEAAVRSSPDHSPERIDALVEEVFGERLAEGQLDESDLTLRNIRALVASFKSTLRAVYHPRIEYPAPTEAEMLVRRLPYRVQ